MLSVKLDLFESSKCCNWPLVWLYKCLGSNLKMVCVCVCDEVSCCFSLLRKISWWSSIPLNCWLVRMIMTELNSVCLEQCVCVHARVCVCVCVPRKCVCLRGAVMVSFTERSLHTACCVSEDAGAAWGSLSQSYQDLSMAWTLADVCILYCNGLFMAP